MNRNLILGATVAGAIAVAAVLLLSSPQDAVAPPSDPWGGEPLPPSGAFPAIQLDRTEGTYALPEDNLPEGMADQGGELVVDLSPMPRRPNAYSAPVPFHVPKTAKRFRPPGMKVFAGDEEIPFSTHGPPPGGKPTWRLAGPRLVVSYPDPLASVRIVHPSLATKIDRLSPKSSGLVANDFVSYEVTLGQRTRPGLLLPAPAQASWDVSLPHGATLRASAAMVPSPLSGFPSDGANVVVSVTADGETTEVDRLELAGHTDDWQDWDIDLSAWEGQDATVVVSTLTGGSADSDYVFLGAPVIAGSPSDADQVRRVLVIGLDTTRPDHLGLYGYEKDTTPELDAWAENAVVFDNAWCPAPRTRPSFRSSTTGRWPLDAVGATNIGAVFRDNGWATAGIAANIHLNPRFDFDHGFDLWQLDVQATADQQVDRALTFFEENQDRDAYMFLHIMDPHLFYKPPEDLKERFVPNPDPTLKDRFNRWEVLNWTRRGKMTEVRQDHISGLYDGEVAYTSRHLGRLFEQLEALPGKTLVVMHSDHGEEFWEHGGYEHNHTLYSEVTKAVLVVKPPGGLTGQLRVDTPTSLVDIAPTVMEFAGIDSRPELDGRSLFPLLSGDDSDPDWNRDLPVAHLRYDRERWGVIKDGQYKYILHTGSGEEELYDLDTDPGEQSSLHESAELDPYRRALGEVHRMPVGPGWRIRVALHDSEPVTFTLPSPAVGADVLNPETLSPHRANLVWGERPKKLPEEVGTVTLSDDKTELTFAPGPDGTGTLWVLFEDPVPAGGTISRSGEALALDERRRGLGWGDGAHQLLIEPGTIVVPPPGEAARIKAMRTGEEAINEEDIALLTALGYVGEAGADEHDEHDDE